MRGPTRLTGAPRAGPPGSLGRDKLRGRRGLSLGLLRDRGQGPERAGPADSGAVSLSFAALALALLLAFGLVVDGSGRLTAYQRAHAVAGEAARAAGQAVDAGAALSGAGTRVDPVAARQAAENHLAAAGVSGSAAVSGDGTRITVSAQVPYRAIVLVGSDRTVSATAEARLVRGITSEIP